MKKQIEIENLKEITNLITNVLNHKIACLPRCLKMLCQADVEWSYVKSPSFEVVNLS